MWEEGGGFKTFKLRSDKHLNVRNLGVLSARGLWVLFTFGVSVHCSPYFKPSMPFILSMSSRNMVKCNAGHHIKAPDRVNVFKLAIAINPHFHPSAVTSCSSHMMIT